MFKVSWSMSVAVVHHYRYLSVLPPYRYQDTDQLLGSLEEQVIAPALSKAKEISERRRTFEKELAKR